ncbi:WD repeat-containing protein 61 [Copidosoma floridanum]|uniref:WD repeat-containing protein 61 n=1 Tax=Copidosoma floridanum TaxID=29053 RepID=UPI0006C97E37|nr:WD repeat-containing protein 61 [Copidosoma floridanum]
MFSLIHKTENAHEDSIWTCAWGCPKKKKETLVENEDSRDSMQSNEDDPEYVITGSVDDTVKVWEHKNGSLKLKHKLTGHSLGVVSVAVNSDGSKCASSSLDSSLRVWDLESGEKIASTEVGPVDIWTVCFSPDDKYIVSGSHAGKIHLYSAENGGQEQTLDTRGGKFTLSVAYSPDGKYIASGAIDGIINIFDVAYGKVLQTLEGHAMPIRSLCFSPDSQLLLTASDDGHMKLYDIKDANVAGTMSGHASWVLGVTFAPDGQKFASSSSDHTVKIWELSQRQCLHTFHEHTDQVWGVKYHPTKNNLIMSVAEDKAINLYEHPE